MLNRPLADLREQDFHLLVTNSVAEGRDLEFKRDFPGNGEGDVKEYLADISSLANAQGGDLIFGIEDRKGVAIAVLGIEMADVDGAILRLESSARDGIEPRFPVRTAWVPLANGRGVLVQRVQGSLIAPHRIRYKNSGRFWSRNSRGKYEMDVNELRQAFTQAEELPLRLRQLHNQAVESAEGKDMPFRVEAVPTAVLSLMPLGVLKERRDLALTREETLLPVKGNGFHALPTLEGLLWYNTPNTENAVEAYALTHRTGRIDAVWTFGNVRKFPRLGDTMVAYPSSFEDGLGEMALHGVGRLQSYGIDGPWVLMVTVLGTKGARIPLADASISRPAWRERAQLPELILEQITPENLLPLYKAFWLLFGLQRPQRQNSSQ